MKKTNLKESLAKMRYLAGLMTEGQLKEFYEEDKYFKSDNKFSPQSPDNVSELYTLLRSEGAKLSTYPEWVLKCLSEDEYVEQVPNSDLWILNREGQSIFRNENKLQQYLIGADESVEPEDLDEEDIDKFKSQGENDVEKERSLSYYKGQLSGIKPGTGQYNPAFKIEARSNGQDTKWIDLNKDSAMILMQWLQENFIK